MEAWLVDVGTVCRYIRYLAGQPDSPVELGPGGLKGLHGIGMTPLVASGDASSHAPHIYAQLGLHTNCLDHLKGMKSTLKARMATAGEGIVEAYVGRGPTQHVMLRWTNKNLCHRQAAYGLLQGLQTLATWPNSQL